MADITITRGTTLPDSADKSDFHNLVDTSTATIASIVNADIDGSAAIADSKLAQITTADKVAATAVQDKFLRNDGNDTTTGKITCGGIDAGANAITGSNVAITGGTITGITDLAIADGGTGSSSTTYCNLASNVTGTLPVANGGTNQTTTGLAFGGKVVSYTGNGADNRDIPHGLGRTPIFVCIMKANTDTAGPELWMTGMAAGYSRDTSNGVPAVDKIQSVGATNVQIGTNSQVNQNTVGYIMFVI